MPRKIVVTHSADWHIGFRQYASPERLLDFSIQPRKVIEMLDPEDLNILTVSGDLLHTKEQSSENILQLKEINKMLIEKGVICLVVEGNHDDTHPHWAELVSDSSKSNDIKDPGIHLITERLVTVYGLTFYGVPQCRSRKQFLEEIKPNIPPAYMTLFHGQIYEIFSLEGKDEDQKLIKASDFPEANSIILNGDIHRHRVVDDGRRWIYSPGTVCQYSKGEDIDKYVWQFIIGEEVEVKSVAVPQHRQVLKLFVSDDVSYETARKTILDTSGKLRLIYLRYVSDEFGKSVLNRVRSVLVSGQDILIPDPVYPIKVPRVQKASDGAETGQANLKKNDSTVDVENIAENMSPEEEENLYVEQIKVLSSMSREITVVSQMESYFASSPSLKTAAIKLLDTGVDAKRVLDEFVESRMAEIVDAG
jgi:DNA repair exonuclease SbcCD nuclease subunit